MRREPSNPQAENCEENKIVNWRLIFDGDYSGAWNMARDEALLNGADASTPPVLRFYDWSPACVSIGRLQKNFAPSPDFDFVRRPTGGRAVLHQHEITYCAVLHREHLPPESRSVLGAYQWLSRGFIAGLETLGVRAELSTRAAQRSTRDGANCFQNAAQCDFVVDHRKLIGASQCRRNDVILQHGSILLEVDEAAWRRAVGGENDLPSMQAAVSLRQLGVLQPRREIVFALCEGMRAVWNIEWERSQFSDRETQIAAQLHGVKYALAAWNESSIDPAGI